MSLIDTTQLGLEAALRGSAARQTAIAQNLANANTPNYRRVDVPFSEALSAALGAETDQERRHALETFAPKAQHDGSAPVRADGNSVDVDTEAAAQAANGLQYEALAAVIRARVDIIEAAMGR